MPVSLAVHYMVNQDCVMVTKVAIMGKTIIVHFYHVYLPKFYHTVEPLITDPVRKNPFRNRKKSDNQQETIFTSSTTYLY